MRRIAIVMFMCLMVSIILPSCEKVEFDDYSQMESFYVESKGLADVTVDSLKSFSGKVKGFVTTYPFANAIKHDFKSKNPTTRWSDIIVLK